MDSTDMMYEIVFMPLFVSLSSEWSLIGGERYYLLPFIVDPVRWNFLQLVGALERILCIGISLFLLSALFNPLRGEVSFSWATLIEVYDD
jgi:hypothetical protein